MAARNDFEFTSIGVSDHWSIREGWRLVNEMGQFDEVIVGRSWLNTGREKFITELGGPPGLPQVIVTAQEISADSLPLDYGPMVDLLRLVGRNEITSWGASGTGATLGSLISRNRSHILEGNTP